MNKKTTMILASLLIFSIMLASFSFVSAKNGNDGPSDSSGDGVSDGSEFEPQNGPNGESDSGVGNGEPAPNSGDGESDGSGW
jgi:hypothetical protein